MRQLTEAETQTLFRKLADYTGPSLKNLITNDAASGDRYTFRLMNSRVYYVKESLANLATTFARHDLAYLGSCIGKFVCTNKTTRSTRFNLNQRDTEGEAYAHVFI